MANESSEMPRVMYYDVNGYCYPHANASYMSNENTYSVNTFEPSGHAANPLTNALKMESFEVTYDYDVVNASTSSKPPAPKPSNTGHAANPLTNALKMESFEVTYDYDVVNASTSSKPPAPKPSNTGHAVNPLTNALKMESFEVKYDYDVVNASTSSKLPAHKPSKTPSKKKSKSRSTISKEATPKTLRIRQPEKWKSNVRKKLRSTGQSYVNSRGIELPEKQMKPPCNETCRRGCSKKISEDVRKTLFRNYWGTGNIISQRDFIRKYVKFCEPAQRKFCPDSAKGILESRRKLSYAYSLPVPAKKAGQTIKVCQTMFLNTFSISSAVIKTVVNKILGKNEFLQDLRGKTRAKGSPRISEVAKNSAREHIRSIEEMQDFLFRENGPKTGPNFMGLYKLYKEFCTQRDITDIVKATMYRQIFLTEFFASCCRKCKFVTINDMNKSE